MSFVIIAGRVYRQAAPDKTPSWKQIWFEVQESKAFNTELDNALRDSNLDEAELIEGLEEEYYGYYEDLVEALKKIDGADCWRAITLPSNVDPTTVDPLGIFWAFSDQDAVPHWDYLREDEKAQSVVVYRGKVDLAAVDIHATVLANVSPSTREGGTELRFEKGSRIWVHEAETYVTDDPLDNWTHLSPERVFQINDWRQA